MADHDATWTTLRQAYDPALLDVAQRRRRAARTYAALRAAGLWPAGGTVLDVGCGSGILLAALGTGVAHRIGCDVRRDVYLQARDAAPGVLFVQADGARLPFRDQTFELVVSLAVIGEFPDWRAALAEMARCVAPGGVLYVTVANAAALHRLHRLLERLGRGVRPDRRAYAHASLRLLDSRPEDGYGVAALASWRYVDVTPHVARSAWAGLRLLPGPWLAGVLRRCAPSFAFAWQRPPRQ